MKKFCFLLLAHCSLLIGNAQPSFVKDSLDAYVQKALEGWKIPGVAVCVIKDGKIDLMKGYGISEWGTAKMVDENTLFGIGSNTKAFTATALALLDAEKKLSLDDKVQKWLPDFKLYDSWVTKEATVRDLLCHRLGFETFQGDFMYFDSDLSKEEVRQKFGMTKPMYGFRSKWGYTNAAFLTAGEVIPKVSGKSWNAFLKERIFTPLGMSRTITTTSEMNAATNICAAHTVVDNVVKKIPYGRLDNMAPAGAIFSSAMDLSKWVMMQLNGGKLDGKEIIPASAIGQTRTPQSILGNGGHPYNKSHFALYGLGWFLEEYSGRKIVSHTGGVNGFVTSVCLVPEEKLGIVVLTNTDANGLYEALRFEIMDSYLGLPYRNYSAVYLQRQTANDKEEADWLKKKRDTIELKIKTDAPLSALAGTYCHPVYGTMNIAIKDGKAIATFEHHKGRFATVESLGGNRYLAQFNEALYGNKVWPFAVEAGRVKSVTVTVADFVEFTPYEFVKEK